MNKYQKIFAAIVIVPLAAINSFCQIARPPAGNTQNTASVKQANTVASGALKHYEIKLESLPKPFASESASRSSRIVEQPAGALLTMPPGFEIKVFAEGEFQNPRMMALAPNGDVFVSDSAAEKIIILRDTNKDGTADERFVFAENLTQPFGMAFYKEWLYVANTNSVVRFSYKNGQTKAVEDAPEKLLDLPGRGYNQHWTRNLIFSPDGTKLYVSVGSSGNVDVESDARRAAINQYDTDGKNQRVFASGIRNPVGLAFNPVTNELWTAVNERDGLGDDLVPDFVTRVKDSAFYGFPYFYIGQNRDPRHEDADFKLIKPATVPDVLIAAHSAALGMVFYDGKMFPKEFQGDAFVALHGSWNREKLTGYKVIRLRFEGGKLVNRGYEDFVTGWLPNEKSREVWGRPVGLLVNSDGSLLICDDGANKIWRVSYRK